MEKLNPDIEVKIRPATKNYEEAMPNVLRDSITDMIPNVSFQGSNRI